MDQDSIPPALSKERSTSISVNRVKYLTLNDGEILDIQPVCRDLNPELETSSLDGQRGLSSQDSFRERNLQTSGDVGQSKTLNSIKEETNDDIPVENEEEPLWDHSPEFLIGDARHHWADTMETNEVDDEIALALIPRKLFETSMSCPCSYQGLVCRQYLYNF